MLAPPSFRLQQLGIELPEPAAPAGAYVPWVRTGSLLVIAGQLPLEGGKVAYVGPVGADLGVEQGAAAARLCAINILSQVNAALGGNIDAVRRVIRLGGFVQTAAGFTDHPKVVNGASDLMLEVFGDAGRHARFAVGAFTLPRNAAVEVEAMFEIDAACAVDAAPHAD